MYRRSVKGMGLTEDGPLTPGALPLEPMFLAFGWEPTHTGVPSKRRLFAGVDSCVGEVFKPRQRAFYFFPGFRRGVSDWEAPGLKRKNYYAIVSCNAEALPPDKSRGSHPKPRPSPDCAWTDRVRVPCLWLYFIAEHSSVLPRVKIASQPKLSFWNSGGCGRVLVAIIRRWREQRMRIS